MDRESGAWNRGKGRKKEKEEGGKKGATRAREIEESRGKEGTRRSSDGERREEREKERHRQGCTDIYRHTRRYM